MKNRILAFFLTVCLMVTLCGCNAVSFNVTEFMSPPKATGEKAAIQELIDKEAGSGYTLKYPQNGSHRSAITTVDFDGDDAQEAIAFYLPAGEAQTLHLLIMDRVDDEWVVLGNHESKSSTVDRLLFTDLDDNGTDEIIVGWSTYNTLVNDLSVYLVSEGESTEVVSDKKYSELLEGSFTGTKKKELLLVSLYTADKPATSSLVALNDTKNSLYTISETDFDADIVSFAKLQTGDVFYGQFGAVIDGVTSSGSYKSQILYYSEYFAELERVDFDKDTSTNQSVRNYAILSCDIDSDGIIEIPNTFKLPIDQSQTDCVSAPLMYWCEYTALGTMKIDKVQTGSLVYGFRLDVPDKWLDKFTAYVNYSSGEAIFYEWDDKDGPGETLLIIRMFSIKAWEDGISAKGYTELGRNDNYVYSFVTTESNSSLLLTNEEIAKAFSLA